MSTFLHYCTVCESGVPEFSVYAKRTNTLCPVCHSLDRQRFFKLWFDSFKSQLQIGSRILHFAPEEALSKHFQKIGKENYLSVDIKPNRAMQVEDIKSLSFQPNSFDFIFCSHVLHHIREDTLAISELHRVLDTNGTLVLLNSVGEGKMKEIENLLPNGSIYYKKFYNKLDLQKKLLNQKFKLKIIYGSDLLPDMSDAVKYGISQSQMMFICIK